MMLAGCAVRKVLEANVGMNEEGAAQTAGVTTNSIPASL